MALYTEHPNVAINEAIIFATRAHGNQLRRSTGKLPYIFHPFDVASEVIYYSGLTGEELIKATVLSLLHDTVEDTDATLADIEREFGREACDDVASLTKDPTIPEGSIHSKEMSLRENIARIKRRPCRVAATKSADRISNLRVFPHFWTREKIEQYLIESQIIADELGYASSGLHARLLTRIQQTRTMLAIAA